MGEKDYSGQRAYNQSKRANVMFACELARRLEATGVTATALHPGMTNTAFSAEDPSRSLAPIVFAARPFMKSPKKGADTAVYLAGSPEVEAVTGRYFANRKIESRRFLRRNDHRPPVARSADLVGIPANAYG